MASNIILSRKQVIYDDNHLFAVNKPCGILSQGDKTGDESILEMSKSYIKTKYNKPGSVFLGLAHRLDRPVSGALLMCRTSKALTRINEMIRKREIEKIYYAVCLNRPDKEKGEISSFLGKNTLKNKAIISNKEFKNSKKATLYYEYVGISAKYHLLRIKLGTGRSHQIRAQLASIDCPILGDVKYAKQRPLKDMSIALHAHTLKLIHPVSKISLRISAAPPQRQWWESVADFME